jgi:S1-C subfamily serine protease
MKPPNLRLIALAAFWFASTPAAGIVGDAPPAEWTIARPSVMVFRSDGACSGVVLAQNLVLTAAHCVTGIGPFKIVGHLAAVPYQLADVAEIATHPQFSWPTADLALLKLSKPLPTGFAPAFLDKRFVMVGDRLIVVGYGMAIQGDAKTAGNPRMAMFVVIGGSDEMLKLRDATGGSLSICRGDSGAPAFVMRGGVPALAGIVNAGSCRGFSWVIPFSSYREWILETARRLGSSLDP